MSIVSRSYPLRLRQCRSDCIRKPPKFISATDPVPQSIVLKTPHVPYSSQIAGIQNLFRSHVEHWCQARSLLYTPTIAASNPVPSPFCCLATKSPTTVLGLSSAAQFSFIWDTGASSTVSHNIQDFVDGITPLTTPVTLKGLAAGLSIEGQGKVRWMVPAVDGTLHCLELSAYYTPGAHQRLLSWQSYIQGFVGSKTPAYGQVESDHIRICGGGAPDIVVPFSTNNNLPISYGYNEVDVNRCAQELNLCVTDSNNQNLTEAQKELLRWHFRLGHLHFESIQLLLRSGALATSEGQKNLHRSASNCVLPRCASCQFGKAKRRPTSSSVSTPVPSSCGALKKGDLLPGQQVSVDHFVCHTKGRHYDSKGKTVQEQMYSGGCLFVDHASGFVHVEHQVSLTSHETLVSKHKFEAAARDSGVIVQSYLSDNGKAFTDKEYVAELAAFKQVSHFAGVGAHHHNGVAERNIQTIMSMARTMMLHAAIRWCDTADTTLWPMAVDYAVYIHNHLPNRKNGLAPLDIFSGTKWPTHKCNDLQVWGSPVYVLDSTMQDGKKLPRWKPRSRRAVFLGLSKKHASTAPLVLNLNTGYISPQFHCVFDSWFSTVISDPDRVPDLNDPIWDNLFGHSHFQYFFDDYEPPPLGDEWNEDFIAQEQHNRQNSLIRGAQDARVPVSALSIPTAPPATSPRPLLPPSHQSLLPSPLRESHLSIDVPFTPARREPLSVLTSPREPSGLPPLALRETPPPRNQQPNPAPAPVPPRRSQRSTKGVAGTRYGDELAFNHLVAKFADWDPLAPCTDGHLNDVALAAFGASSSDPDTLRYDEAMRDTDALEWRESMHKEITSLIKQGTWEIVSKSSATTKILPGTWTLRRKRHPDGRIKSLKARWCVRGDLQEPMENTFAPVVMWSTVRLLMYFTLFFKLHTRCIDFSNAFVQAALDEPIYVHLPRGYQSDSEQDVCLKLTKSLYGLVQAPRLWFDHLKAKLETRGFTQSSLDPCLFYCKTAVLVCYVDDIIMAGPESNVLDALVADLKVDADLTEEGELAAFLGIQVSRKNDTFTLTQTGLTDRIISTLGLNSANPTWTPTTQESLGSDVDGLAMTDTWNYRSVIGMLLYLSNNSRPDIAFAVHQCARFSHAPKQIHALAIKAIGRYLIRTRDKGLILSPSGDLGVDCYVDADFAGLWLHEDDQNPLSVKSRTGYLITIGGCPLTWTSKLQTEVALSTMEAEYIALSHSMRELIPIRALVQEMAISMGHSPIFEIRTYSKVFEDNNGALILASSPRMTPRSKHIAVKYHFFRSHVANGHIKIIKISTTEQKADIFTKGLVRTVFESIRKLVMGW